MMEFVKKLTKIQISILLLIAGITSLIALVGLSHWNRDYYVSAAISRAIFWAILLLVISSPLLYYFRKKEKRASSETKEHTGVMNVVIVVIFVIIILWGLGILGIL